MRAENTARTMLLMLLLCAAPPLHAQTVSLGLQSGLHLQWSENTLRFLPGLGAAACLRLEPFEIEGRMYAGGLFGYSLWISLEALYALDLGDWRPRIGLSLNLDWGEYIFHTQSASGYVRPVLPEAGIGLVLKLLVFSIDRVNISVGRILLGTGFEFFGRTLLAEFEFLGLTLDL